MISLYLFFAEEFLNGIKIELKKTLVFGVDLHGGDTTLETKTVSDSFRGRQVICFPRGNLLCYYREAILYDRRWMCSSVIHELKSTKTCFDYGICKHGTCLEKCDCDEKREQSLLTREHSAAVGIIVMGCILSLLVCTCCCGSFFLASPD